MVTSNQISPGMTLKVNKKLYRVESSVKVTVPKGTPFIKTKLRDLSTKNKIVEKNFKLNQEVEEVSLTGRRMEFLYTEGKHYLFLDIDNLGQVTVPVQVVGDKANYLKEGTEVKGSSFGETIFSIELPLFMELMVTKTEGEEETAPMANVTRSAILETGAKIEVPPFIEVGDIIKVDTSSNEYIQRV